jgi:hypothetical protein
MFAKLLVIPAALALMALAPAHAAPAGVTGAAATLKADTATVTPLENVTYRRHYGYYHYG